MSRSRIGQSIALTLALGLVFLLPNVSRATTVTIPAPFNSLSSTPASLSTTNSLSISNNSATVPNTVYFGTLQLNNNDVILIPTIQDATHGKALYNAVNDMARSGSNGGAQDGTGISSYFAKIDALHGNSALGVGVLYNDDGSGGQFYGGVGGGDVNPSFDGYSNLTPFDTIVKYTFLGDTFLRGFIDTFDTSQTQNNSDLGFVPTTNYWQQGDFYYQTTDGVTPINTFDTSAVFNDQVLQSQYPKVVMFAQPSGALGGGTSLAVPEPSSMLLVVAGALAAVFGSTFNRHRASMIN